MAAVVVKSWGVLCFTQKETGPVVRFEAGLYRLCDSRHHVEVDRGFTSFSPSPVLLLLDWRHQYVPSSGDLSTLSTEIVFVFHE